MRGGAGGPKVVLVSTSEWEREPEARAAGVDAFLVKPFTRCQLLETLIGLFVPADGGAAAGASRERTDLSGLHLLLAEDDEFNRQLARHFLERGGAKVSVAGDGAEAVRLVLEGETRFDLVLMDIEMPRLNGYQATRLIREDPRFQSLPILAVSASDPGEEGGAALDAGMDGRVAKPIDPLLLLEAIRRYLPDLPGSTEGSYSGAGKPVGSGQGAAAPASRREARALLAALERYLLASDSEAIDHLARIAPRVRPMLPAAAWKAMEVSLKGYQFDKAAQRARGLIDLLERE